MNAPHSRVSAADRQIYAINAAVQEARYMKEDTRQLNRIADVSVRSEKLDEIPI